MKVDIIAELGINHNGDFNKAVQMISEVKRTGVQIVKFQHYDALKLLGPNSPYLDYAGRCQFTKAEHEDLKTYCNMLELEYLVTVFDKEDIPWADSLCKRHKVASRMNKDKEFIETLINTGKEVIISTQTPNPLPCPQIRYMFCIPEYPTPIEKMQFLPCNENLGLSSHCPSIEPSLKAIAQGANLIEHHITYSRQDSGCDHPASITFSELAQLNHMANRMNVI